MARVAEAKILISADDQASAQIVRLQAQVQALNAKFNEAGASIRTGMQASRQETRLLADDLGLHLNRELVNIIASSKLAQGLIAAAFAPAAIVGFVDVGIHAYKGLVSISEQLGGLTAETKKFMEEASADNKEFIHLQDEVRKAKESAALAGVEGEQKYRLELQFATADAARLRLEILQLGAAQARLGGSPGLDFAGLARQAGTSNFGFLDALAPGLGSLTSIGTNLTDINGKNDEWLKGTEKNSKEIEKARAEYEKVLAKIEEMQNGNHLAGVNTQLEEATKRAREFGAEMQKAGSLVARETLTPGQQKSREITNTIDDLRVAALTMTPAQQQAAASFIDQLYDVLQKQNLKNEQDFTKELRKGLDDSLKAVLATTPSLPTSPLDELKSVEKQIQAIFSAERAGEEELKSAAESSGQSIILTEQQIIKLRKEHNLELQQLILRFKELAAEVSSTNPEMIEKAQQFQSQMEKLNSGFKTVGGAIKDAALKDTSNFFESIISGSQSAAEAFKAFAKSIIADLAQIITKMIIMTLIERALKGIFGGGGISGGGGGGGFDFGEFTGRAVGGPVTAGMPYLVGEHGPEPFIPSTSGTILPHSALMGGSQSVQVNVINNSSQQVDAHEQSRHYDAAAKQFVVSVVLEDISKNGAIRSAMANH